LEGTPVNSETRVPCDEIIFAGESLAQIQESVSGFVAEVAPALADNLNVIGWTAAVLVCAGMIDWRSE
jgi:hypothetical protein